jgi:hypothetical protein
MKYTKPSFDPTTAIRTIRGEKVILDGDLAKVYDVSTGQFNQAIHRNAERFINPESESEVSETSPKREIGFHVKDTAERKSVRSKRAK